MKKIFLFLAYLAITSTAYAASSTIWGATDRGPVLGTYRIPVDTSSSSGAGQISVSELQTYITGGPFTLTTTGTSGAATLTAGTLNIPQYSSSTFQQSMASETQLSLGGL